MAPHPHFKQSATITPLSLTQFSYQNMFDPSKEHPKCFVCLSDQLSSSYDGYDDHAMNYAGYGRWNTMVDDESGVSSPPVWRITPPREENIDYRCLSPSSRVQAIIRGQRELMEMISKMPESCYELTLKDLVEYQQQQQPVVDEPKQESFAEGRGSNSADELNNYKRERQSSQKQKNNKSGSLNNGGFLLKMGFPVSLGSKKKKNTITTNNKKIDCNASNKSKISPKPTVVEDASGKTVDKDWCKKRSESSNSCRSTGSTSGRRHRRKTCLAFIFSRNTKASR